MCSARASLLVVAGPGDRPDGCPDATLQHARRLGLQLAWQDASGEAELVDLLRGVEEGHAGVVLASGNLVGSSRVAAAVGELRHPVVHVDTVALDHLDVVHRASDHVIHGRHRRSFHGALDLLASQHAHPPTTIAYGTGPDQVGDLRLPTATHPAPVVVLLHGGFWLDPYERDLMGPLAVALTTAGWATWNVEYRRRGRSGGGWPTTLDDVCAAIDSAADLAADHRLDLDRVVLLGHSAGAQLAVYAAARSSAPSGAPGAPLRFAPAGLISLAGVLDLEAAANAGLGGGAVTALLGTPEDHPDRYRVASPVELAPVGIPQLAVHGPDDRFVPVEQTHDYVAAARDAGDDVEVALVDASHFDIIQPDDPVMPIVSAWLEPWSVG